MYDIINNIISHSYVSTGSNEQSYIYYACITLICLLTVLFVDIIRDIFHSVLGR